MTATEIRLLILKDLRLEFRQRASMGSMLLYVASTLFVCYLAFDGLPEGKVWVALFWVVMLFACTNAAARGFLPESGRTAILHATLVSHTSLMASRLIGNGLLMCLVGGITFGIYVMLFGSNQVQLWPFLATLLLGTLGFSSLLTFIAAMAGRAGNVFTLTAVLGFPLSFPLVLSCIRLTTACTEQGTPATLLTYLGVLLMLDLIIIALAMVLFPYFWKEHE